MFANKQAGFCSAIIGRNVEATHPHSFLSVSAGFKREACIVK
jgi:hypothetical protein